MTDGYGYARQLEPDRRSVARDDALLDLVGRGEPVLTGDPAVTLLAAWRAEAIAGTPPVAQCAPVAAVAARGGRRPAGWSAAMATPARGDRRLRRRSRRRLAVGVAAGVAALTTGVAALAVDADPDSPLWPVTRLLDEDRADSRQAEEAIAEARRAASEGRHGEARRYLERAAALIDRLGQTERARRLREQSDEVRRLLAPEPAAGAPAGAGPAEGVPAEETRVAPPRSTDRGDSAGIPARTPEPSDRLPGTNHLQAGYGQPSAAGADGHGLNTVPRPHPGP